MSHLLARAFVPRWRFKGRLLSLLLWITITGLGGTIFWNSGLFPYLSFLGLVVQIQGTLINIQSTWLKASVYQGFPFKSLNHYKKTMLGSVLPVQHLEMMLMILESKDIFQRQKVTRVFLNLYARTFQYFVWDSLCLHHTNSQKVVISYTR